MPSSLTQPIKLDVLRWLCGKAATRRSPKGALPFQTGSDNAGEPGAKDPFTGRGRTRYRGNGALDGWPPAKPTCCRPATSMSCSRSRPRSPTSRPRTRRRSTTCCSTWASQTMLTSAADHRHLGAGIGLTAVLRSWGSALKHHTARRRRPWICCRGGRGGCMGSRMRRWRGRSCGRDIWGGADVELDLPVGAFR